jgi:Cell Wall Hydrolase
MVASRIRVISAPLSARFWFSAFCIALMPTSIGYQDLAALVAQQHGISTSWHLIASPLGTIDAGTFNFTRPVGSAIPESLGLTTVNFDPRSLDAYAWKIDEPPTAQRARQIEYPSVNREHKGDRLPASTMTPAPPAAQPVQAPVAAPIAVPPPVAADQRAEDAVAPLAVQMDVHNDASVAIAPPADIAAADAGSAANTGADSTAAGENDQAATPLDQMSFLGDDAGDRSTAVYFGTGVMGAPEGLQSWAPGAAPILADPAEDSGLKLAALEGADYSADESGGETIVGKDQSSLLQTPAQRLGLTGKLRAHAEECLQQAIYFEARGEPYNGQQAVAQVVMNRVFSGFYPHDVCGVVFQNAEHHLACQFTFACEGKDLTKIEEPDMWDQAKQIAKDELDGKFWLADIGHATHYHAYWVHPSWVHEMVRLFKLGVHTFYRPRNWGDGDEDPAWGAAALAQLATEPLRPDPEVLSENPLPPPPKSTDAVVKPEAAASPAPVTDNRVTTAKL